MMNPFKTSGLVAMAIAFSACGPAGQEQTQGAGTAQLEAKVTAPLSGTRSCWADKNSDFGGQTSNPITYASGTYRQRSQGAIKLNATKWSPAQSSSCTTLANDVPCTFKEVLSGAVSL